MRHRHRLDANHHALRETAEAHGFCWLDCAQTGLGIDAILLKGGHIFFAEVKDGSKPLSKQQLTPHEQQVHRTLKAHGVHVHILTCEHDILELHRDLHGRREERG